MIRVYNATERLFDNNGKKILHPLFAEITKVDNGDYYVEIEDILDNSEYYQKGQIYGIDTPWGRQGFRCDNPIIQNNRISCKAWHLSYDSKNYVINSATAELKNCNDALNHYNDNTDTTSPFTVISNIGKLMTTTMERKSLFDVFTELISEEYYGGSWYRDNYNFGIMSGLEQDKGVVLAYNKNITDIEVSENWDNVCTKLLPYVENGETIITLELPVYTTNESGDSMITSYTPYVTLNENLYPIPFTKTLKFECDLNKEDSESDEEYIAKIRDWLYDEAVKYLHANNTPVINCSVSAEIDNVSDVGEIIHVKHPKCKTEIPTNVISVKYDAISERYTSIEFGNFKKEIKNLTQEVASVAQTDSDKKLENTSSLLKSQLESASASINSILSASYVINSGNEILIVDKLPKETAVNCIKINNAGIGFSKTGIYGTFTSAWTIDGTLNMQATNVINLTASLIKGGTLKLGGTNNASGTFELYDNSNRLMALMDKSGLTVYATNGDYVKLNAEEGFAGYNKAGTKIYWADGDVFRMRNAEVENEIKIAGKIKIVPVSTSENVGVGFVALS